MSEKDYAPLSAACMRALHDKLYDKRKTAAQEVQKMVEEFNINNKTAEINRIIKIFGQDLATSQNIHGRKGGLIGLAAVAIALGKDTSRYTEELIKPILACFSDADARVRFYASESMYNVVKVARGSVLPHFAAIFNALSKIATDPDQDLKNASELLDKLMKDIVTESTSFDLNAFMPLLRERIYTKNSFARQFVISWISVLDAVPNIDLVLYLPELLDGLFRILDDPMVEVKNMCNTVLGEFLRSIKSDPNRVDFGSMINILINHAQDKSDDIVQFTAITWIKEFVQLSGPAMLPHMSGIFTAVLPCLAYDTESRRNIKETATAVNYTLMKLIALREEETSALYRPAAGDENERDELKVDLVVEVLTQYLAHNSVQTKVAVLKWIYHLYTNIPNEMFNHINVVFPALQRILSDQADEVVQQSLVVIAEIISSPNGKASGNIQKEENVSYLKLQDQFTNPYYYKFYTSLLNLFSNDKALLEERGVFIIRQLCVLLNPEDIYRTLAQILLAEENLKFASLMVEHLNMILLTSPELFELRCELRDLNTQESSTLFVCLYETWCHNPVATVALCLLTQCYNHVCDLIRLFGCLEITVDFLTEIDKLVQLIESPIFAYLRLELLDMPCDYNLVRALYGLLMLLPQTEAFRLLRTRLSCIPSLHLHCTTATQTEIKNIPSRMEKINFQYLLTHFKEVQEKQSNYKKTLRAKESTSNNLDKDALSYDS